MSESPPLVFLLVRSVFAKMCSLKSKFCRLSMFSIKEATCLGNVLNRVTAGLLRAFDNVRGIVILQRWDRVCGIAQTCLMGKPFLMRKCLDQREQVLLRSSSSWYCCPRAGMRWAFSTSGLNWNFSEPVSCICQMELLHLPWVFIYFLKPNTGQHV